MNDTPPPEQQANGAPRRNEAERIGWALTALTCLVLAVGVLVIRHTSRDARPKPQPLAERATPPTRNEAPPAEVAPAPIVLRPTPPGEASVAPLPRPIAGLPGADTPPTLPGPGAEPISPRTAQPSPVGPLR